MLERKVSPTEHLPRPRPRPEPRTAGDADPYTQRHTPVPQRVGKSRRHIEEKRSPRNVGGICSTGPKAGTGVIRVRGGERGVPSPTRGPPRPAGARGDVPRCQTSPVTRPSNTRNNTVSLSLQAFCIKAEPATCKGQWPGGGAGGAEKEHGRTGGRRPPAHAPPSPELPSRGPGTCAGSSTQPQPVSQLGPTRPSALTFDLCLLRSPAFWSPSQASQRGRRAERLERRPRGTAVTP